MTDFKEQSKDKPQSELGSERRSEPELKTRSEPKSSRLNYSYAASVRIMLSAYIIAIAAAYFAHGFLGIFKLNALMQAFAMNVIATTVIYCFSLFTGTPQVFDPYWALFPPLMMMYWIHSSPHNMSHMTMLTFAVVCLYSAKHAYQYFGKWKGFKSEDFRYESFRKMTRNSSILYWIFAYFAFHLSPATLVYLGSIPLYHITRATHVKSVPYFYGGLLLTTGLIFLYYIADQQLSSWKAKNKGNKGTFIDEGLWAYSRHPNYFCEVTFWFMLNVILMGTNGSHMFNWIGAFGIAMLFNTASIPMMEGHMLKKTPSYAIQKKRVSRMIFWRRSNVKDESETAGKKPSSWKKSLVEW